MILKDLTILGFGKFHDKKYVFENGINVVYGSNEAGKSTIHSFIRAMLYGMERSRGRSSRTDFFSRYEPWSHSSEYGGILRVEKEKHIFRIERNFFKNPKDVTVTDETSGNPVTDTRAFFRSLLSGLSETAYMNTVSIGQLKSATDSGMVNELKNYIANMNTTGNLSLNITKASAFLKDQRKSFSSEISPEAARNYAADLTEIRQLEAGIASPAYKNNFNDLQKEKDEALRKQQDLQKNKEALIEKAAAGKQELKSSGFESRDQILSYQKNLADAEDACNAARKNEHKKSRTVWSVLLILFAAVSFALSVYLYITWPQNPVVTCFGFSWELTSNALFYAAVAFFLVSFIPTAFSSAARGKRKQAEKTAADIRGEHADNPSPDTLLSLCDEIDECSRRLSDISSELSALSDQQNLTSENIEKQQKSQWELEQQLEHLSNLKDDASVLKKTIVENDRLQFEIDAIDLALETMTNLSSSIRNSFGLYLNKEASDLINGITGGIYNSMSIDENLNVFMNTKEKLVPLDQVSSGTMDQIYLALRLASANLMQDKKDPLPLFFDDSFVNYDEERLCTALQWLSSSMNRQSLIFTCHRREAQLLSSHIIPYRLIELEPDAV